MAVASGPAVLVLAGPVLPYLFFFEKKKYDIIVAINKEEVKLNA